LRAAVGRHRSASVAFIFVVLLLDTLGFGVIIPVLPRLIEGFCGGDIGEASRYLGAFGSAYAAMQFVFAPVLGALSDRLGRRPVILASLLGAALDYMLLAFAPSLAWLFVGRVVAGLTGASFSAATAYIADVTPPEKRAQSFGLIGAAFGIGFVLGPAMGGVLAGVSLRAPFLVAAGLNALNLGYGLFVLPESLKPELRRPFDLRRANPLGSLRQLARSPVLFGFTGTLLCAYLAQQILHNVWALYTQARFDWLPVHIGISLAVVGVMTGVVQGGLVRVSMQRLGEQKSVLVGLVFNAVGFVAFGLATQGWMMYALIVPFSLGGIAGPAIQSLLTREVGPTEQGELQGSLGSLQSVTAILGPVLATSLFARFAPADAVPHVPGAAFFAAAGLNALGIVLASRLFGRLNRAAT
jgi:MFS transporter, DHA1 family, tetracycline resistance protein